MNKIKLGIIFFGNRDQYPVNWHQFLDLKQKLKDFEVKKYDLNRNEWQKMLSDYKQGRLNVVLKNSYGRGNENLVEIFLEKHKIPFLGSGAVATIRGTSKFLSKKSFQKYHLPVIQDVSISKAEWKNKHAILGRIEAQIGLPCIIKDAAGTDSRGLYIASRGHQIEKLINTAIHVSGRVIVEKFIPDNYEATCFVVGNQEARAFEPVGLKTRGILDAKTKDQGGLKMEIPSHLSLKMRSQIKRIAVKAHKILGCRTFSRSDFLVKDGKIYLLETDVHPGFRKASVTTLSAKYADKSLNDLFLLFIKLLKK